MSTIPFKPGTTVEISGTYTLGSLAGVSLFSDAIRGNQRVSLTCEVTDESAGGYTASLTPEQTEDMFLGLWKTDVLFVDTGGNVFQTHTYYLLGEEGITRVD